MAIKDYSTNPDQNTTINGIYIGEGCSPANLNNAMRQYMADVAEADIAGMAERTEERATAAEEAAQEALSMVSTDAEVSRAWAIGSDAEVPVAGEHSSKEYARIAGSYATVAQNEVSSFTGQVNTAKSEIQTLATNSTNALNTLSDTLTSDFNSLATQASTTVNNAKNEAIAAKDEAVNAAASLTVDDAISSTSTNPVQNKIIYEQLAGKQNSLNFSTGFRVSGANVFVNGQYPYGGMGAVSGSVTLNASTYNIFYLQPTKATTINITGATNGRVISLVIYKGGSYAITWGMAPYWDSKRKPTLGSYYDVINFLYADSKWFGFHVATNMQTV